ncbi:methyl-accepting chemotaxis protein [Geobacter sp. DSM 9736]|uniref:methyl-accepting chemotaxis protein n=1 Tax=Geobacter sp. DSM 9736 TaxID=1277350 RepID=UPI000B505CC7|nr:methyl-accepting chemotaxis protein [Geobacter sp. DSM 9736]SNB46153.1 methyl-accepting chemotaxis protein [Geobacter sp. DSM 9736]
MKLGMKVTIYTTLMLVLTVAATAFVSLAAFRQQVAEEAAKDQEARMSMFWELLRNKGKDFRIVDNRLMAGDYVLNGNYELPDKIKEISGGVATVFMGDTRVTTNVLKPDGTRAVGTKLQGPAYESVIKYGKKYRGEAPILGTPYFTAYDPIKDAGGRTVGVLFVGVKKSDYLASFNHLVLMISVVAVVAILAAMFLIRLVLGGRIKKLKEMSMIIGEAAAGNIAVRVDDKGADEIGEVGHSVNKMLSDMNMTLTNVIAAARELSVAAVELNHSAEHMAAGVERVAAQAGSIATASEEMAATCNDIARNCSDAAEGSRQANECAMTGAAVVSETVMMMSRIAEQVETSSKSIEGLGSRSDQIGAIVGTIEDIADQTNLLALNAAIEAARAGEQGRGFAVVADEVRALAERTTRATKEISTMIKAIQTETKGAVEAMEQGVTEVQSGSSEAAKSCDALSEILTQIDSVTMQVNQIATAAEQQNATAGEISGNILQITEVVNDTARDAQGSANAASRLAHLADDLQKLVNQFKLAA